MENYNEYLFNKYAHLRINLVRHDTSLTGLPAYIEVDLEEAPKDKGTTVLDLGNYIYRQTGLSYQSTPEYRGTGPKTTLRWFMSWDDIRPIQEKICAYYNQKVLAIDFLPISFQVCPVAHGRLPEKVAIWKKTGELVLYRKKISCSEIEFDVKGKKFIYLQAELGPISDFEILGEL